MKQQQQQQLPLLLHVTILIGLLTVSAAARPCKTLFITSFTFTTTTGANPNPNLPSSRFLAIVTEFRHQEDRNTPGFIDVMENDLVLPDQASRDAVDHDGNEVVKAGEGEESVFPFGWVPYEVISFLDRSKDVVNVVVALLFGMGCGALTAATMYLIWSLFFPRFDYYYNDDDCDVDNSDVFRPKKYGYVKIPEAEFVDSTKPPPLAAAAAAAAEVV